MMMMWNEKVTTCWVKDVLVNKHFGFMMIRSVMFLNYLEAAPALVGWWHEKESRLVSQLITSMVQTWTQHMDKLRHGRRLRKWILSWSSSTIHHLSQQERWFFEIVLSDHLALQAQKEVHCDMSWTILFCTVSWQHSFLTRRDGTRPWIHICVGNV